MPVSGGNSQSVEFPLFASRAASVAGSSFLLATWGSLLGTAREIYVDRCAAALQASEAHNLTEGLKRMMQGLSVWSRSKEWRAWHRNLAVPLPKLVSHGTRR